MERMNVAQLMKEGSYHTQPLLTKYLLGQNAELSRPRDVFNSMASWYAIEIMVAQNRDPQHAEALLAQAYDFPPPVLPYYLRPILQDTSIIREACEQFLPRVHTWLSSTGNPPAEFAGADDTNGNLVCDMVDAVKHAQATLDGYEIAHALDERHCWPADEELVNLLRTLRRLVWKAGEMRVRAWVKFHGIRPQLDIGAAVSYKHAGVETQGTIVMVRDDTAHYVVGDPSWSVGKPHPRDMCMVPFEAVRAADAGGVPREPAPALDLATAGGERAA